MTLLIIPRRACSVKYQKKLHYNCICTQTCSVTIIAEAESFYARNDVINQIKCDIFCWEGLVWQILLVKGPWPLEVVKQKRSLCRLNLYRYPISGKVNANNPIPLITIALIIYGLSCRNIS